MSRNSPWLVWVVFLVSWGAAPSLLFCGSQETAPDGQTVLAIEYDPQVQPIDTHDLADAQTVAIGKPLDRKQVAATIDRLFATGLYQDIKVHAEPQNGGIVLRFTTVPQKFVGHVIASGKINDPPSRQVILSQKQLDLGKPFDPATVEEARKSIEEELKRNGLFQGTVGSTTIEDPITHQVTIGFLVHSGKRARFEAPVITGDPKLPDRTIIAATGWRIPLIHRWRLMTKALTDKGIDGLEKKYAKKDRLTASIDLTGVDFDEAHNRAQPRLDIQAGPVVEVKALEAKISKSKLRKYVPVFAEGTVDNDLLTEGARNLRDYFQSRGYPDADVSFRREAVKDDHELINFYISTGPRRRLVNVKIEGSEYFSEHTLRERMFLTEKALGLRYGRYSESFRNKDEESLTSLYQANGFREARVSSTVEPNFKGKESDLGVTFHINEGPQWRVSALEIKGPKQLDLAPIRDEFASVAGQPFADVNVSLDRDHILQYYFSQGFVSATFNYRITPDLATNTVVLTYQIREGMQQFVRQVLISGLDNTRHQLVEKEMGDLEPGQPISSVKIGEVTRKLSDLGIFSGVTTATQDPDGRNAYKYLLYDFDEANRYTFNFGVGVEVGQFGRSTNELNKAGGAKGISPIVSFDINRINFLGRAQTLSLQLKYSTLAQRQSLSYIIPRFMGSQNRVLTFSGLYDTTQDVQTFSSRRAEASAQISQRFNRASTVVARFAYRRVSVGDVYIPALLVPQLAQPVRIGSFSLSYIQDHRDNPSDAHSGFYNTVDTAVAGGFFGSQRNFVRVLARNATYISIHRNLVFARQTQIGFIMPFNNGPGISDFDAIPLPERFFGGGGVSMRGFGDNQAGPRDIGTATETGPAASNATGFPIGGNGLFFNTFELRFPLFGPNIRGAFFHDMGNIYTSFSDISLGYKQKSNAEFNYAVQSPGFGIRYKTPLGPLRVDFSYALNPPNYIGFSKGLTIQDLLSCGNTCPSGPQRLNRFNFFFSIGQAF